MESKNSTFRFPFHLSVLVKFVKKFVKKMYFWTHSEASRESFLFCMKHHVADTFDIFFCCGKSCLLCLTLFLQVSFCTLFGNNTNIFYLTHAFCTTLIRQYFNTTISTCSESTRSNVDYLGGWVGVGVIHQSTYFQHVAQ